MNEIGTISISKVTDEGIEISMSNETRIALENTVKAKLADEGLTEDQITQEILDEQICILLSSSFQNLTKESKLNIPDFAKTKKMKDLDVDKN